MLLAPWHARRRVHYSRFDSRALRRLQRETKTHVFVSERGAPLSVAGYQRMIAKAGEAAGFSFLIHSHMLRPQLRLQARQRR